jgi:mannose-1-phosphate guanylyltransferase
MSLCNRGSAVEILLAVLTMLERDPWARVVAMPSHHYVDNEPALTSSLLDAATPTAQTRNKLTHAQNLNYIEVLCKSRATKVRYESPN